MLKKILFAVCLTSLFSCNKSVENQCVEPNFIAPANEISQLATYVPNDAIQHASGFYYVITTPGTNIKPTVCSGITVNYTGSFLPDNTIFESSQQPVLFTLGGLIIGWQKGIPLIGEGGQIDLYLPPSMAYGAGGSGSIPPNAYLKFTIQLLDVQ